MAGKHISVTHVAGSNTKFMGNGGQHGIATAAAASLCVKYHMTPRGIHDQHLDELQAIVGQLTETNLTQTASASASSVPGQ
ncbi:FAD-dependent oxidoreductase [Amycolatopsis sp. FU40]|uniref:FAD-dependent oxidoreductase n=1 Tax=Amycolatopsis sp. FU40 TaxID=2914159 RepID=UPI001F392A48|nr:FAD-dependent oxidoreductase [Amycolatopsis sp. FU40]UKD51055.1 FAD-dependent oxidoreductase [Amycolatopsis sp. FU40]